MNRLLSFEEPYNNVRPRAREAGLVASKLPTGAHNAISDVSGVRVGHATLISGEGALCPGRGPVRTGVTVILPHAQDVFRFKVRAAAHAINGYGKACGFEQVRELGMLESPIALTNTLNVGLVADALVQYAVRQNPDIGVRTSSVNVVVGETNDGYLNDLQGRHVRAEHVWAAIDTASDGAVPEGAVGAGTGVSCFGWKGGIGTSSRVLPAAAGGFSLGALVQANYGDCEDLRIDGAPVGRHIQPPKPAGQADGSVMIVLATDVPLSADQLRRLCVRAAAGLARTGSVYAHGSGDFVIAFTTAYRVAHEPGELIMLQPALCNEEAVLSGLFLAVVESVEEAVLNALCAATTMIGRDGNTRYALPIAEVAALVRRSRLDVG